MIEPRTTTGVSHHLSVATGHDISLPQLIGDLTGLIRRGAGRREVLVAIVAGTSALARTPHAFLLELAPPDALPEHGAEALERLTAGPLTLNIHGPNPPVTPLLEGERRLLRQLLRPGESGEPPALVTPARFTLTPEAWRAGGGQERLVVLPLAGSVERATSVLALFDSPIRALAERDRLALQTWAGVVALALEQLALREAERRTRLEGEELREVALTLTSTLDLDAVLARVLAAVRTLVGADWASIALVGEQTNYVARHFSTLQTGQPRWYESTSQLRPGGMSRIVLESRQPHFVNDLGSAPDANPAPLKLGVRAVATLPMVAHGESVGLLYANFAEPHTFTPREGELLSALAAQAAVAIRNAELYSSLQRSEGELRAVLESQDAGICLTDREGIIRFANRRFGDLVAVEPALLIGRALQPLLDSAIGAVTANPGVLAASQPATDGDPEMIVEEEVELGGVEPRLFYHSCYPAHDETGAMIGRVDIYEDITELRRLERVRDDFLAIAAHELRTPLTVIRSHAYVLKHLLAARAREGEEESLRSASTIVEQSAAMAAMVAHFLDVVRLGRNALAEDFAAVDLSELLARAVEQARGTTDRHEMILRLPSGRLDGTMIVHGNTIQLARVLTNLLDNAIKYSPDGGTIAVEAYCSVDQAVLCVRDEGLGLTEDQARRLFVRYYQAHGDHSHSYSGLGLGLYLCKEIISRHGGRIEVESAGLGRGSTFTVTLPLAQPAPATAETPG